MRRDEGFTLVEMLLAISILGVGILAIVGGMMTSIQVSDLARRQAEGMGSIRSYAEAVAADTYVGCATSYPGSGFTVPSGWTSSVAVSYWSPATSTFASTCGSDSGFQRVTLTLTASDGRDTEVLRIDKRLP